MKGNLLLFLSVASLLLSACGARVVYEPVPLAAPTQPVLAALPQVCQAIETTNLQVLVMARSAVVNVKDTAKGAARYQWTALTYNDDDGTVRPLNGAVMTNNVYRSGRVLPAGCDNGLRVWEVAYP